MSTAVPPIVRGRILQSLKETSRSALNSGHLIQLSTQVEKHSHLGNEQHTPDSPYELRLMGNLDKKENATKQQQTEKVNPFLPYEEKLFVSDLGSSHRILLNKYAVLPNHALIVTSKFENQTDPLNLSDFEAIKTVLDDMESALIFFNCGNLTGASQPHKHIQFIPEPPEITISPYFNELKKYSDETVGFIPIFPFAHLAIKFVDEDNTAQFYLDSYNLLMRGICKVIEEFKSKESFDGQYNFLMTRTWMLLVPRNSESVEGISINSIGFSGSVLVRSLEQLEYVKKHGWVSLLSKITYPRSPIHSGEKGDQEIFAKQ